MVTKINISIPEDVLRELDQAAHQAGISRSAFLTQSVKRFLEEREEQKLLEQRRKAAEEIDRLREEFGPWDGTAEVLKWRSRR